MVGARGLHLGHRPPLDFRRTAVFVHMRFAEHQEEMWGSRLFARSVKPES